MENGEYELASLIASEISSIGLLALKLNQENLITDINIRFNTFNRKIPIINLFLFFKNQLKSTFCCIKV